MSPASTNGSSSQTNDDSFPTNHFPHETFSSFSSPEPGNYTDPNGVTWYGKLRSFKNEPINIHNPFTEVGHVMIGPATFVPPLEFYYHLPGPSWLKSFFKRCEFEVYCRWHGLRVPQARSAEMYVEWCTDNYHDIIATLALENDQMERQLKRFHLITKANIVHSDHVEPISAILSDPSLASDNELSDFEESSDDDQYEKLLPASLCLHGTPLCCWKYVRH